MTLAEAIKQIVMNQASCHILACAPSNSAADQLCEQILMFKPYRLFARGLESKHVPDILKVNAVTFEINHITSSEPFLIHTHPENIHTYSLALLLHNCCTSTGCKVLCS